MTVGLVAHAPARRRWRRVGILVLALGALALGTRTTPRPAETAPPPEAPPPEAPPPPTPEVLASEPEPDPWAQTEAFFVQIVGDRVYWNGNGGLWSAAKDGSHRRHHVGGWVLTFRVEGEHVTYTTDRAVMRARLDGRGARTVVSAETEDPIELASDGSHVYYTMFGSRQVRRVGWAGGRAARFARGGPSWTIAIDATHLYIAEYSRGRVVKVPTRGGRPVVLARGLRKPVGIALDGTSVFIACEGDGSVRRIAKTGGRVARLATGQFNNDILAVDDHHVYWGDWNTRALMRARKDGSGRAEVAMPGLPEIVGIAVDAEHVVLASDGHIVVLAKERLTPSLAAGR